ncbi:hypothetical protein K3495_g12972 [Podosphaera aphanis]|nr:hypothetical protein K3495_g12972 [Podosphaera aphanis]
MSTIDHTSMANVSPSQITMAHDSKVLGDGISFTQWKIGLQAKLAKKNVIGHVFHDIPGVRPITMPIDPTTVAASAKTSTDNAHSSSTQFLQELEKWILGEIQAKNVIIARISPTMCPSAYDHLSAKQLFDAVAGTRFPTVAALYASSLENLFLTKFLTSADDYINRFLEAFQNVKNAADAIDSTHAAKGDNKGYHIGAGLAATLFILGTKGVEWLSTWRDTTAYEPDTEYVSLQSLISSLRIVAANQVQPKSKSARLDPDANCKKCRHRHKNRCCFRLHPEFAPDKGNRVENSSKKRKAVVNLESNTDTDSGARKVVVATTHIIKTPTTYKADTPHYFV